MRRRITTAVVGLALAGSLLVNAGLLSTSAGSVSSPLFGSKLLGPIFKLDLLNSPLQTTGNLLPPI
jgi:hypothetical protein